MNLSPFCDPAGTPLRYRIFHLSLSYSKVCTPTQWIRSHSLHRTVFPLRRKWFGKWCRVMLSAEWCCIWWWLSWGGWPYFYYFIWVRTGRHCRLQQRLGNWRRRLRVRFVGVVLWFSWVWSWFVFFWSGRRCWGCSVEGGGWVADLR